MKISGFGMGRNTSKLYYPVKQSIASILPIVDEFVFALGASDEDDRTREEILSLQSDKIKIIDTVWDLEKFPGGTENPHQTDIAKEACTGDWLIYMQADEVIHEDDLPIIVRKCEQRLDDHRIEGFLLNYIHFYGDYDHFAHQHGWYQKEIRIIRNLPEIHSFWTAQSFRKIPDFDGKSYQDKKGTEKLTVESIDARIFHYGWVRPPEIMQSKSKSLATIHKGVRAADQMYADRAQVFDYGNMSRMSRFEGTHPAVMKEWMEDFHWGDQLHFEKGYQVNRPLMKHEKWRYRILGWIEQNLNGGKHLFDYHNWHEIKPD